MKLLNAVTTDTTGATALTVGTERVHKRLVQIKVTGTATVKIQGRINASQDWYDIGTYTATGVELIQLFPEMRAVTSGMSSATVTVDLDASSGVVF